MSVRYIGRTKGSTGKKKPSLSYYDNLGWVPVNQRRKAKAKWNALATSLRLRRIV